MAAPLSVDKQKLFRRLPLEERLNLNRAESARLYDILQTRIFQLEYQNRELSKKLVSLEDKVNLIWFAPGMPGMLKGQEDFYAAAAANK
jgi:hypothetical protein